MASIWIDSEKGNDLFTGLSQGEAIKTITKLNTMISSLNAGDHVYFIPRRTPYWGLINENRSGSSGNQIVFEGYTQGSADRATLANPVQANSANNVLIVDVNASYVTFRNLRFQDSTYAGIIQYENKTGLVVENCEFTLLGDGIRLKSGGFAIYDCYFHDLNRMVVDNNVDTDYGAVAITFEAPAGNPIIGGVVHDCRMERCIADSRYFKKDGSAFEFFRGSTGIEIYNIEISECNGIAEFGGSGLTDTISGLRMWNIKARDNRGLGFFFNSPSGGFNVSVSDAQFDGMTIVTLDTTDVTPFYLDGLWGSLSGVISITNSIFVTSSVQIFKMNSTNHADIGTMTHTNNVVWRTDGSATIGYTLHASEVRADPLFIDLAANNLRLQSGSPARGIGVAVTGHTADLTGRTHGSPRDVGALEYVVPTAVPGAIKKAAPRARMTDRSTYGTDSANNLVGGWHNFDTEAERDDLLPALRVAGMGATVAGVPYILAADLKSWIPFFMPQISYEPAVCEISYTVASNTAGGNGTVDVYSTRPLNTIDRNFSDTKPANPAFADVALASNQITLTAGNYFIGAWAVCNKTNATRLRLYNITDSAVALRSPSAWCPINGDTNTILTMPRAFLSIKKTTVFELQQITDSLDGTTPTYQFGRPIGATSGWTAETEVYARVTIERVR